MGGADLNRLEPLAPAAAYKTYTVLMPVATHWRDGTCEEVGCAQNVYGWATEVDERTDLGQQQAYYIRHDRTRNATEERMPTGLTRFTFGPGQQCFSQHKVPLDRPSRYLVRDGDWRGNPRGTQPRVHVRAEDWVDDFATHQQKLADEISKG